MGEEEADLGAQDPGSSRDQAGEAFSPQSRSSSVRELRPDVTRQQREGRIRALVQEHYDFIYRTLRRVGLLGPDAEDAVQEVFLVAARRVETIATESERSFLIGTALRVAATRRRGLARRREFADGEQLEGRADTQLDPEEAADRRRAVAAIDDILQGMSPELRAVFVLFEIEEVPTVEIAQALELPAGTVASRLRRAREVFRRAAKQRQARDTFRLGAGP